MQIFAHFIQNLQNVPPVSARLLRGGLLLTNALLLAAIVLYLQAGPVSSGNLSLWESGNRLVQSGAVVLLGSNLFAALFRRR